MELPPTMVSESAYGVIFLAGLWSTEERFPGSRPPIMFFQTIALRWSCSQTEDAVDASDQIANQVAPLLFPQEDTAKDEALARAIFEDLQNGKIDRALFSDNANAYFSEQALKDLASGLGPLGAPQSFTQARRSEGGGMTFRLFKVKFAKQNLQIWQRTLPDGKIEQYQVMTAE